MPNELEPVLDNDGRTELNQAEDDFKGEEEEGQLLEQFRRDIETDAAANLYQRRAADEDLAFLNLPGGMWEGYYDTEFQNRVKLQFPMINDKINRTVAEWNGNKLGVEFKPDGSSLTSDKDAKFANGVFRKDFRRKNCGKNSLYNAVLETFHCGQGAWLIGEEWVDKSDPNNLDQYLTIRAIFNAYQNVFWDDSAQEIDMSDARRVTVLRRYTNDAFKSFFGKDKNASSAYTPDTDLYRTYNFYDFDTRDFVYVASRYAIIRGTERFYVYNNMVDEKIESYNEKEHEELESTLKKMVGMEFVTEKVVELDHVEKSIFSGDDFFMKAQRISGRFLPVIQTWGYRMFVADVLNSKGLVRDLKDPSRLLNQQASKLAESAASPNRNELYFAPEQVESEQVKASLKQQNPLYRIVQPLYDKQGKVVRSGPETVPPPVPDPNLVLLMQFIPNYIEKVTGGTPQETLDPRSSGKAMLAAKKLENQGTQPLMENLATSIEWMGTVWLSKAQDVYNSPRAIQVMEKDGTETLQNLMQSVENPKTGSLEMTNTFQGKKFAAYADVGPQYESEREEKVDISLKMIEVISKIPGMEDVVHELANQAMENIPGDFAAIRKLSREMRITRGTLEPETPEEIEFKKKADEAKKNQVDPQEELMKKAAFKEEMEGKNLQATAVKNLEDAKKKAAETQEIIATIPSDIQKTESETAKNISDIENDIKESLKETEN